MSWHRGRMVAFDLETTDTDPTEARIVTSCVAEVGGGEDTVIHPWLIDPGVEIPERAAAVHGVTTERARAEGQPAAEGVREVIETLARVAAGLPLVVFNARYDLTVLSWEARRHGLIPLEERIELYVVDPLVVDRWLDRYRKGRRTLGHVAPVYGVKLPPEDAHDATADAMAAARIAWVMGERGRVVRRYADEREELAAIWARLRGDLEALAQAQVAWAEVQADGLERYFAEKGTPKHVERAWPLVPPPSLLTT